SRRRCRIGRIEASRTVRGRRPVHKDFATEGGAVADGAGAAAGTEGGGQRSLRRLIQGESDGAAVADDLEPATGFEFGAGARAAAVPSVVVDVPVRPRRTAEAAPVRCGQRHDRLFPGVYVVKAQARAPAGRVGL